jgi:hypothetical protein
LNERVLVVARHGMAALLSSLTFTILVMLSISVMSGVRADRHTPHVYVFQLPDLRLFQPAPEAPEPSVFDREAEMGTRALIDRWQPYIDEASRRFALPASWIRAVIRQESGGRTVSEGDQPITSAAGAQGLMQLMPDTYDDARRAYGLGANAYDPHDNVMAGASYLRTLYQRYGFPAMFAAYNDGPGNYEASLRGDRVLPEETKNYLAQLSANLSDAAPSEHRPRGRHSGRHTGSRIRAVLEG